MNWGEVNGGVVASVELSVGTFTSWQGEQGPFNSPPAVISWCLVLPGTFTLNTPQFLRPAGRTPLRTSTAPLSPGSPSHRLVGRSLHPPLGTWQRHGGDRLRPSLVSQTAS